MSGGRPCEGEEAAIDPMIRTASSSIMVLASDARSLVNFRGQLLLDLQREGRRVIVAAPGLRGRRDLSEWLRKNKIEAKNIDLDRTGMNPLRDLANALKLYLLFRAVKPDAVLAYTIKPIIFGIIAAHMARVREKFALVTGLGYAFVEDDFSYLRMAVRRLVAALYKFSLSHTDAVIFQNQDDRNLFLARGIIGKEHYATVVNGSGVDLSYFSSLPFPPNGRLCFLMVARLLKAKGVREYAESAAAVRNKFPETRFLLVGAMDSNPDGLAKAEIDKWVDSGVIEWLGEIQDVRLAIRQCHVFVLPSYREGTPRAVLEAMACGRPVITTTAPGCRETVREGENGYLVAPKSVNELTRAMLCFCTDPQSVIEMGSNSRVMASEKFDVHSVNRNMMTAMGI